MYYAAVDLGLGSFTKTRRQWSNECFAEAGAPSWLSAAVSLSTPAAVMRLPVTMAGSVACPLYLVHFARLLPLEVVATGIARGVLESRTCEALFLSASAWQNSEFLRLS